MLIVYEQKRSEKLHVEKTGLKHMGLRGTRNEQPGYIDADCNDQRLSLVFRPSKDTSASAAAAHLK